MFKSAKTKIAVFSLIFLAFVGSLFFGVFVLADGSASITTDKDDYSPEETVLISGTGFVPNAQLLVRVTRPDSSIVTGDGSFGAWPTSYDYDTSDNSGDFEFSYILDGIFGTYTID